jgi:hypothetical protein
MRSILLAAMLCAGPVSAANYVYEASPGNGVYLSDAACKHAGILSSVADDYKDQFRKGRATIGGREFALCWIEAEGRAYLIYEDADQGVLPMRSFKKNEGV